MLLASVPSYKEEENKDKESGFETIGDELAALKKFGI